MKKLKVLNNTEETKHFCVLPWIHFHAWPDKRVMPCCVADSDKPVATTDAESILDLMNSDRYKEIRKAMLNDERVEECRRCYELEDYGVWTMRKSHNHRRMNDVRDIINDTNEDGSIDEFTLKYLDIRFSNICNMKCRTCGPACSSRWAEEHLQEKGKEDLEKNFNMKTIVVSNNSNNNDLLMKLAPYLLDVEEVYFAGGEALITPEHYTILDYWLENDHTDVEISYTTNFLTLRYKDRNALDYWKNFKNIEIFASLDADGDLIEIMRHGAKWDQIYSNILRLKEEVPHAKFRITPTISIYNVYQFPKFHQTLLENNIIDSSGLRLNILTKPWFMSLDVFPKQIADKLILVWRQAHHDIRKKYGVTEEDANGYLSVISALERSKGNVDAAHEFFKKNDGLDNIRNEKLLETVPELKEYYTWMKDNS